MNIRRSFMLASIVAAFALVFAGRASAGVASAQLAATLREMYFLSDSAFASLVHWARAGAPSPKIGAPAYSVEFALADPRGLAKADQHAVLVFLRGGGRAALYAQGATDAQIGNRNPVNVPPPTPAPTPTPNPYRTLEFGSPTVGGPPAGNVAILGGWAAVQRDGRAAIACISFKNTDARTATRVLLHFPVSDEAGATLTELTLDRRGTFSPNTDIHGWESLGAYQGGSHRGKTDNCAYVGAAVAALPLLAARFATYRVERVEYADGTSWSAEATPAP